MATYIRADTAADPLRKFRFTVHSLSGRIAIPKGMVGFHEVDGLTLGSTDVIEYVDGNDLFTRKLAGRTKFGNVTLKKGTDLGRYLEQWREIVMETLAGQSGYPGAPVRDTNADGSTNKADFRSDLVVSLHDRVDPVNPSADPYMQWLLKGCWPTDLTYDSLAAQSSEVLMQTCVLCVEEIQLIKPARNSRQ